MDRKKVCIIGQGNVAEHLSKALSPKADVVSVNSRTLDGLPREADLYIISVSDAAVEEVSGRLADVEGIVVHTSGSVGIGALRSHTRHGVFYPLQTFSKGVKLDYSAIPVFLEAEGDGTLAELKEIVHLFTPNVYEADSHRRAKMHLAAVFSCNFVNRMLAVADDILAAEGLDFKVVAPLVQQTIDKALALPHPAEGQTGPASRGDKSIIELHLGYLTDSPRLKKIYQLMSDDIMEASGIQIQNEKEI